MFIVVLIVFFLLIATFAYELISLINLTKAQNKEIDDLIRGYKDND